MVNFMLCVFMFTIVKSQRLANFCVLYFSMNVLFKNWVHWTKSYLSWAPFLLLLLLFLDACLYFFIIFIFFPFIFIHWRLITFQYCSGFCHTLTWISHRFTYIPHPDSPSHLPLHPIPLGLPSAPGPSTCLMHPTWGGDLFHPW